MATTAAFVRQNISNNQQTSWLCALACPEGCSSPLHETGIIFEAPRYLHYTLLGTSSQTASSFRKWAIYKYVYSGKDQSAWFLNTRTRVKSELPAVVLRTHLSGSPYPFLTDKWRGCFVTKVYTSLVLYPTLPSVWVHFVLGLQD